MVNQLDSRSTFFRKTHASFPPTFTSMLSNSDVLQRMRDGDDVFFEQILALGDVRDYLWFP